MLSVLFDIKVFAIYQLFITFWVQCQKGDSKGDFVFHHLLVTVDKRVKKVIKKGDVTSFLHSEEPRKKVMKKN